MPTEVQFKGGVSPVLPPSGNSQADSRIHDDTSNVLFPVKQAQHSLGTELKVF